MSLTLVLPVCASGGSDMGYYQYYPEILRDQEVNYFYLSEDIPVEMAESLANHIWGLEENYATPYTYPLDCEYHPGGVHDVRWFRIYHHYRHETDSSQCRTWYNWFDRCINGNRKCEFGVMGEDSTVVYHAYESRTCSDYPALADGKDAVYVVPMEPLP